MSQITTITSKTTNVHGEEMIVTTGALGVGWVGLLGKDGVGTSAEVTRNGGLVLTKIALDSDWNSSKLPRSILYFAVFLIELSYIVCLLQLVKETGEEFFCCSGQTRSRQICILYTIHICVYIYIYKYLYIHYKETRRNLPKVFQTPKNNWKQKGHQQKSVCFSYKSKFFDKHPCVFLINPSFLVESMCFVF